MKKILSLFAMLPLLIFGDGTVQLIDPVTGEATQPVIIGVPTMAQFTSRTGPNGTLTVSNFTATGEVVLPSPLYMAEIYASGGIMSNMTLVGGTIDTKVDNNNGTATNLTLAGDTIVTDPVSFREEIGAAAAITNVYTANYPAGGAVRSFNPDTPIRRTILQPYSHTLGSPLTIASGSGVYYAFDTAAEYIQMPVSTGASNIVAWFKFGSVDGATNGVDFRVQLKSIKPDGTHLDSNSLLNYNLSATNGLFSVTNSLGAHATNTGIQVRYYTGSPTNSGWVYTTNKLYLLSVEETYRLTIGDVLATFITDATNAVVQ